MDNLRIVLILLAITLQPAFAQLPDDQKRKFDEAERRIVRLPPTAFRKLPPFAAHELQRRGCAIPQTPFTRTPHNVIHGDFAKSGQGNWAVLCSVKGVSTILVFWKGSSKNPAEIAALEDRFYLQGISLDHVGYSRAISAGQRIPQPFPQQDRIPH